MIEKAAGDRCPGIVHQHADARIFTQALLDPGEIPRVRQIRRHHVHHDASFAPEALGQCGQARRIAGNQDEIVTAARKSICMIAQAVGEALSRSEAAIDNLPAFRERYLSPDHRDNFAGGCPVAALASEAIRQDRGARATMTSSLKRQIELLGRSAPGADKAHKRRAAIGSWAAMVGALILARVSDDSELSDEILSETRAWLAAQDRKSGRPRESHP